MEIALFAKRILSIFPHKKNLDLICHLCWVTVKSLHLSALRGHWVPSKEIGLIMTDEREREKERGQFVLSARFDDDDVYSKIGLNLKYRVQRVKQMLSSKLENAFFLASLSGHCFIVAFK